jgi:hypothetical protein
MYNNGINRKSIVLLVAALAVHAVFCVSLHYQFLNPLFYITTHAKGQGGPFFGIYQAGVNLSNGESIYACEGYRPPTEVAVPYYHFYRYLPFCSFVSSVVARFMDPWKAYWTWIVINELLLAACVILTFRLRRVYGPVAVVVAAFWLLFSPLYIELYMGQFCFTMTVFIFLVLYPYLRQGPSPVSNVRASERPHADGVAAAMQDGGTGHATEIPVLTMCREDGTEVEGERASPHRASNRRSLTRNAHVNLVAGVCWILSILLKSFTAIYSMPLLKMGKKKLVLAGALITVLTSLPYFLLHPQDFKWFLHLNFQPLPGHITGGALGFNPFLRDISERLIPVFSMGRLQLGFFDIAYTSLPTAALLLAILLCTIFLTLRRKRIDPLASITLWTLTFFLIFKDIWEYHYVMLIPLFVGYYLKTRSKYLLVLFILIAVPTPFLIFDVPGSNNPQALWSTPQSLLQHSIKAIPTLLFYLWVVKREIREMAGLKALFSFRREPVQSLSA